MFLIASAHTASLTVASVKIAFEKKYIYYIYILIYHFIVNLMTPLWKIDYNNYVSRVRYQSLFYDFLHWKKITVRVYNIEQAPCHTHFRPFYCVCGCMRRHCKILCGLFLLYSALLYDEKEAKRHEYMTWPPDAILYI